MGALTVTVDDRWVEGNKRHVRGLLTFSTSYATGGDTGLTAAAIGMDSIEFMTMADQPDYNLEYVYASGNVIAFFFDYTALASGAAIQVAATTNLSPPLATIRWHAIGV